MLLEKLCNADGVSGDEHKIREIIKKEIAPYTDEITTDTMGNLIAYKKGSGEKKVMLCAHMDEVGFIVTGITDKGYLKFDAVGGIDTRVIISKKVRSQNGVCGIIGIKAIHLQTADERKTVPKIKNLYIDIGAKSKEDAEKYVKPGEYFAFDTEYCDFGNDKVKAKAIDDRVGCCILADVIKHECKYDLYCVFTVQEEVGTRGAAVCACRISPDACLVLEGTTCYDVHGTEPHEQVTTCGGGAALSVMDRASVSDRELTAALYDFAAAHSIPVQYKKTTMGGNDAGAVYVSGKGVKTAALSVPCRYLHSPVSVCSKTDIKAATDIACGFCENIGGMLKWNT